MLPPLASIDAFTLLVGDLTGSERLRAEAVLRSASSLVRDEAGKTWVNADGELEDVPETAYTITLDVAKRAFENPQGLTSEQYPEYTWRGPDTAEPGVYLTPAEARRLKKLRSSNGLWVQATTRQDPRYQGVFVNDQYGGDPLLVADDIYW